jgi:hypothetical protein
LSEDTWQKRGFAKWFDLLALENTHNSVCRPWLAFRQLTNSLKTPEPFKGSGGFNSLEGFSALSQLQLGELGQLGKEFGDLA